MSLSSKDFSVFLIPILSSQHFAQGGLTSSTTISYGVLYPKSTSNWFGHHILMPLDLQPAFSSSRPEAYRRRRLCCPTSQKLSQSVTVFSTRGIFKQCVTHVTNADVLEGCDNIKSVLNHMVLQSGREHQYGHHLLRVVFNVLLPKISPVFAWLIFVSCLSLSYKS